MTMASLPKVVRAGSPALVLRDGPVTRAPELCRGHPNARSATPAHKDDGRGFNFKSRPVIFLIFLDFLKRVNHEGTKARKERQKAEGKRQKALSFGLNFS